MILENYEINNNTLALIPMDYRETKILENNNVYFVNKKTTEIIDHSCKFFGSSYLGRFEGTKCLVGFNYKSPIIIEETKELIFFPTSSPRFNNCFWISLKNINNYEKSAKYSKVKFNNGQDLELDISFGSLENQILRATRLSAILRSRI